MSPYPQGRAIKTTLKDSNGFYTRINNVGGCKIILPLPYGQAGFLVFRHGKANFKQAERASVPKASF